MLGKILIGVAATIVVVETVNISNKYKAWRYWERALNEIPWPKL